mmetsp:Transcript_111201/g.314748  ORF Transcript_111201/g.314748 Transcript_111201/m.314748 type:complete len:243 (+) Transcript_111201:200-928(+)
MMRVTSALPSAARVAARTCHEACQQGRSKLHLLAVFFLHLGLAPLRAQRVLSRLELDVGLGHARDLLLAPHLELLARLGFHLRDALLGLQLLGVAGHEGYVGELRELRQLLVADLLAHLLLELVCRPPGLQQRHEHVLFAFQVRHARPLNHRALRLAMAERVHRLQAERPVARPRDVVLCHPAPLLLLVGAHLVDHVGDGIGIFDLVLFDVFTHVLHGQLAHFTLNMRDELLVDGSHASVEE